MKNLYCFFFSATVFALFSCSNQSANQTEPVTETPATTTAPATPPVASPAPAAIEKDHVEVKKDTPKTEINIGEQGGSVKTKSGSGVSVDKKGVKVGTKDVNINIGKDSAH